MPAPRASGPPAIGIITPSANVVVERVAIGLARALPGIDVHFTRIPVSGAVDPHPDGYDLDAMRTAASLLADARPDVIVWAGSKGVLVGVERDRELCELITASTGIPATTSSLALCELAAGGRIADVALVTPYTDAYQQRLIAGFARVGIRCVGEVHAGIADNLEYASIDADEIRRMTRAAMRAAATRPDAVLAWCTNFPAAFIAREMEDEFGVPFLDATVLALWHGLARIGIDLAPARSWGSVFTTAKASGLAPCVC